MNDNHLNLRDMGLFQDLLLTPKKGDQCIYDDSAIYAILDGSIVLTKSEYLALIDSPATLNRMSELIQQRKKSSTQAANDVWYGSEVVLRAASQADSLPSLLTDDELFTLNFMRGANQIMMLLKINELDARASHLIAQSVEIMVRDGKDELLLEGSLDEEGELQGVWPYPDVSPFAHLQASGGKLSIKPVLGKSW